MKTLYIAEKPDIATAIAAHIWPNNYKSLKTKTCYTKDDTTVTWAFGHILMTAMPEAYGEQFKSFSKYPIYPEKWIKLPAPSAKEQLAAIKKMLKTTDVVVNGGDPDREGQLLIDEILEYCGYKGTVNRILINAKDDASMTRAFETIVPDSKFRNLYEAGMAREQADWLVGMNLSRAYSVSAKKKGLSGVWRIGRVKIPTLALVVAREREIENFQPVDYFNLLVNYQKDGVVVSATITNIDDEHCDSEGRIIDKEYLEQILAEIRNSQSKVSKVEQKSGTENAPLPYSLDTLQVEANRRYGMSPSSVLQNVQSLYEKKLVSYPRCDCNYIPTSQHSDAPRILKALTDYGIMTAKDANADLQSKAFNDSKITAHHALIPTGEVPEDLNDWEKKIYMMISLRYIVQFYPPCKFDTVKYEITCGKYKFTGSGKSITSFGWKSVTKGVDEDIADNDIATSKETSLPKLVVGDILISPKYEIETKQTQPPKRFTEGTLLAAMTNIWKFVSKDNPNREKLKECKGIGTPATRDTIISELMAESKNKGATTVAPCIRKVGKELVPTAFGTCLIDNIDETLTMPDFTAVMEYNLSAIAEGKQSIESFMRDIRKLVDSNIDFAEGGKFSVSKDAIKETSGSNKQSDNVPPVTCPVCKKKSLERKYSPKTKNYFWVCSDKSCVHPVTKKTMFYEDSKLKPVVKLCPDCRTVANRLFSRKTGKSYWHCPKCDKFINDDKNKSKP